MLELNYDISQLKGAEYNPRFISKHDQNKLAESLKELGIVKPIIARGKLIVAGHQRTTQLLKLGIKTAPVYILPCDTTTYDEVRFNQFHNGTDLDSGDEACRISGLSGLSGFVSVKPSQISGNFRSKMAEVRKEISRMILKYGSFGASVATESGEVIHCAQYALASKLTNSKLTVYVIKDSDKSKYQNYLNKQYGVFSYDHLDKKTYIQTYAQKFRLRTDNQGSRSTLYEKLVIPYLNKNSNSRGIDFGAGQGDYAKLLRGKGLNLHDVELFRRIGASDKLDVRAINSMIDKMCYDLRNYGQYDYVVCDSVLNSVDSVDAETSVINFLKGLCKLGGIIFFSGRRTEFEEIALRSNHSKSSKSRLVFLDKNGFTANYRKGHWFYQKFHSQKDVENIIKSNQFECIHHINSGSSFQVQVRNTKLINKQSLIDAINFEFNLPLSDKQKIGRADDVIRAFTRILGD